MSSVINTQPSRDTTSVLAGTLLGGVAAIFAITLVAYTPAFRAGFVWDDESYVEDCLPLRQPDGLKKIWFTTTSTPQYYPMVFTSFWLEYRLWGLHPAGYHVVNICLHAAGACLLWRVLRSLAVPGALLGALLFAVHPVQVESVAWITERKNVLSGLFFFASLLAYLRFAFSDTPKPAGWGCYALSLLLFAAALLSKSITCSLPVVILILLWWKRDRLRAGDVIPLVPMIVLGACMAATTVWVEHHHVGTKNMQLGLSPGDRVLLAGQVIWFYLGKLLVPVSLTFSYAKWTVSSGKFWQWLAPLGLVVVFVLLWSARSRIGKAPLAAAALYVVVLGPALGFVDIYPFRFSWVADHFQYLAAAVPLAALSAIVARVVAGTPGARWAAIPLLALLAFLTRRQTLLYADRITLWQSVAERNPSSVIAQTNLAAELLKLDRPDDARLHTARALALDPRDDTAVSQTAMDLLRRGQNEQAVATCNDAIALGVDGYAIRYPLGLARMQMGQWLEARGELKLALSARPDFALGHLMLAETLTRLSDRAAAASEYREVLRIEPQHMQARARLIELLVTSGAIAEALPMLEELVQQQPDDIRYAYNLVLAYQTLGRSTDAEQLARRLVAAEPRLGKAHHLLGTLLMESHRSDEGMSELTRAAELDPSNADIRVDLALALSAAGRRAEAVRRCQEALQISPGHKEAQGLLSQLSRQLPTTATAPAP